MSAYSSWRAAACGLGALAAAGGSPGGGGGAPGGGGGGTTASVGGADGAAGFGTGAGAADPAVGIAAAEGSPAAHQQPTKCERLFICCIAPCYKIKAGPHHHTQVLETCMGHLCADPTAFPVTAWQASGGGYTAESGE